MANQNLISLEQDERIEAAAARLSMNRREFLQFCAALATTLGLPQGADAAVAEAFMVPSRKLAHGWPVVDTCVPAAL